MMKRFSIALMTLAAALVAVSCQKEAELQEQSLGQMTITAVPEQVTTPDLTKAEMAYKYDVLWQTDDEILVRKESEKSTKATFKLKTGEGTTKGIFSYDESPFQPGDGVEAFYPASLVEESKLIWPAIQENNQVAPMFCKKNITTDTEEFNFKSLGAVVQIVLSTPMKGITLKSISIKDGTKAMSGEFEVGSDDQAVITDTDLAGITLDLGEGVAIGEAAKYFNIAVPAGKYENLTLTFTATDGSKCVMTSTTMPEIKRNVVGKLTISAPQFTGGTSPTGALEGVFSVAEGRTVHFSQGNLWYGPVTEGAPATFNFETNQYDYTLSTIEATSWDPNHISHFFWSKEASVAYAEKYSDPGAAIDDVFFTNADETTANPDFTVNGVTGKYRSLSEAEWFYLFNKRTVNGGTGKDKSYSLNVTYGGRMGLVLYPDNYDKEPISGTVTELPEGVVFLPASGSGDRTRIRSVGQKGSYWSSSASRFGPRHAYPGLDFFSTTCTAGNPTTGGRLYRNTGYSVRLVTETINHLPYVAVESVTLDKTDLRLAVGKTGTLSTIIAPGNATNKNVVWTSNNTTVANVYTVNGVVYVEALAEGTATITAIVDASHTASCTVTVYIPVKSVTLDKTELTLTVGKPDVKLTATVTPENATDKTVSWNSDNTDVATVDQKGNVCAVAPGTATFTVTTTDGSKTAVCLVTVKPLPPTGTAKRTGDIDVNWVQLWENGPKFAEYNVGASSETDYGGYYAWGGSQDKVDDHNTDPYILTGTYDTATNLWGSNWRMPNSVELKGLFENCDIAPTDNYNNSGKAGWIITGKGDYEPNSIFLPAAGFYSNGTLNQQNSTWFYWSSTPDNSNGNNAYATYNKNVQSNQRSFGFTVRAVLN